jgi:hypothetical protein
VLAYELVAVAREEAEERHVLLRALLRQPGAPLAIAIIWPSLAVWMMFDRYDDEDEASR